MIIGIDPGLTRTGYAVLEGGKLRTVGVSATDKDTPQEQRLLEHWNFFEQLFVQVSGGAAQSELSRTAGAEDARASKRTDLSRINPATREPIHVSIERPFLTEHNPDTAFGTAQVAGLIMVLSARYAFSLHLYTPSQVKLAVTGSGAAQKAQIALAVKKILKLEASPKPADASDAVAIALTAHLSGDTSRYIQPAGLVASDKASPTQAQTLWLEAQNKAKQRSRAARKM